MPPPRGWLSVAAGGICLCLIGLAAEHEGPRRLGAIALVERPQSGSEPRMTTMRPHVRAWFTEVTEDPISTSGRRPSDRLTNRLWFAETGATKTGFLGFQ
jgi:hypothetical protein